MQNVFSTDENVASNSNLNRPAANSVSVVVEHSRPALFVTSGNASDFGQTEPQEKKKEDKSSKLWGQSVSSWVTKHSHIAATLRNLQGFSLINRPLINTIAMNGFGQFGSCLLRQIIKSEIVSRFVLSYRTI